MDVRSAMTADPACCTPATPLHLVARMMVDNDCGEIPVVDDHESRRPVGVVTDRDITVRAVARGLNPLDLPARDIMTTPVVTVNPETPLRTCCDVMESHQIRRVLVVDDAGKLCGIVAVADVAKNAGKDAAGEVVREVSEAA
jgi:CBS domain-containing protein